jgi:hypothetical protein
VHVLLPKVGNPAVNVTFAILHQYAKNFGATLNNVYAYDADQMLYLVEYANYNIQGAIGRGVDDLYQPGINFSEAATSSNIIKIPHSDKAKLTDPELIELQKNILETQAKEIELMKRKLKEFENK